jgi:serine/threonine protein kinase
VILRLSDFGLVRVAGSMLTKHGTILGTLSYLSPEAARDEVLDERADIWSLAVVLFEMLSGARPFPGRHPAAVLWSIAHQPPAGAGPGAPDAPPALRLLLRRMLAKDRSRRPASACEVVAELEAIIADSARQHACPGSWGCIMARGGRQRPAEVPRHGRGCLLPFRSSRGRASDRGVARCAR